ncbi:MAG: radical SAM protein [Elusimicrobia bacterium]|nr:radical SAM protein [Candidatus Liberimonas magnetica]
MQKSASIEEREIVLKNNILNSREFTDRKLTLESYPRYVFVQLDAPCNQDCLFCSRPAVYSYFNFEEFKCNYEKKLLPVLTRAERINLTGSGELLLLPEAKKILGYFNQFKYAEKMFATNGSSLTPKMVDFILESGNIYTIHVSIHSSNEVTHETMTKSKNYGVLIYNLEHLKRSKGNNLRINFIFLATTKNIENLPDFIDFAKDFDANSVIVYYNYVYRLDQKDLSCYFIKEKTNKILDLAKDKAQKNNINVILPPRFGNGHSLNHQLCSEAWTQLMINPEGDIITCDVAGDSKESLKNKEFMDVWNGDYYKNIRKKLIDGKYSCSQYCFRANPSSVNDFKSHIITRGKNDEEINKLLEGA